MNDLEFLRNLAGKQQEINDTNSRLEEMTRASNAENTATSTAEDTDNLFNVDGRRQGMDLAMMVAPNSGAQGGRQIEYNPSIVDKSAPDLNDANVLDDIVKQMALEYTSKLQKEGKRFGSPNSATDGASRGSQQVADRSAAEPQPQGDYPPQSGGGGYREAPLSGGGGRNEDPPPKLPPTGRSWTDPAIYDKVRTPKVRGPIKPPSRPTRVSPNDPTISMGEMRADGGASSPAPEGYTRDVQLGLVKNSPEVSDETWLQATRMENPVRSIDRQRVSVGPGKAFKGAKPEGMKALPPGPDPRRNMGFQKDLGRNDTPRPSGGSPMGQTALPAPKPPVKLDLKSAPSNRTPGGNAKEIRDKRSAPPKSGPAALPSGTNPNQKALPPKGGTFGVTDAQRAQFAKDRKAQKMGDAGAKGNGQRFTDNLNVTQPKNNFSEPMPLGPKSSSGVPSGRINKPKGKKK